MSTEQTKKVEEVTPNTAHAGGVNAIEKDHGLSAPNKEYIVSELSNDPWDKTKLDQDGFSNGVNNAYKLGNEFSEIPKEVAKDNELLDAYKVGASDRHTDLVVELNSYDSYGEILPGHGIGGRLSDDERKALESEISRGDDRIKETEALIQKNNERLAAMTIADDRFPDYKPGDLKEMLPPRIEKEYVKVGDKFHYGFKPDLEAFHDKGNALETKSAGQTVTKDLIDIAAARGWEKINVKGSEEFKRQVWLEASMRNIDVRGYKPTDADKVVLQKAKEGITEADKTKSQEKAKEAAKKADRSPQALEKEKAQALRGGDRTSALKRFPDLINAYALIKAAELLAEKRIQNPEGKQAFVDSVKESLASQVERGEKIPDVQYKDRGREAEAEATQSR